MDDFSLQGFDADAVVRTERPSYDAMPTGDYLAILIDAQRNRTRNGHMKLDLTFEVIDGDFKGRKVWHMLNLGHPNEKTKNIALSEMADFATGTGKRHIDHENELMGLPVVLGLDVEPKSELDHNNKYVVVPGKFKNKITGFRAPGTAAAKSAGPIPSNSATSSAKPWQK